MFTVKTSCLFKISFAGRILFVICIIYLPTYVVDAGQCSDITSKMNWILSEDEDRDQFDSCCQCCPSLKQITQVTCLLVSLNIHHRSHALLFKTEAKCIYLQSVAASSIQPWYSNKMFVAADEAKHLSSYFHNAHIQKHTHSPTIILLSLSLSCLPLSPSPPHCPCHPTRRQWQWGLVSLDMEQSSTIDWHDELLFPCSFPTIPVIPQS